MGYGFYDLDARPMLRVVNFVDFMFSKRKRATLVNLLGRFFMLALSLTLFKVVRENTRALPIVVDLRERNFFTLSTAF
jgi:hypothetical protein